VTLRIATWNVNSLRVREDHVRRWVTDARPDVLCLQETKVEDKKFPHALFDELGLVHRAIHGQKTYNGVAICSRLPLADAAGGFTVGPTDDQARLVRATVEGVRVLCCYVPNGSSVGSEKFSYKMDWLGRLRAELDAIGTPETPVVVCGDFNIAPAEADVWDPFEAENELLFHPFEHKALAGVTSWGLRDALRIANPTGPHFSWWDYRQAAFRRNMGYRIDHHWVSEALAGRVRAVTTAREVRGWEQPSDHVPVMIEIGEAPP
jgi:exodeoxyribonuclease III